MRNFTLLKKYGRGTRLPYGEPWESAIIVLSAHNAGGEAGISP